MLLLAVVFTVALIVGEVAALEGWQAIAINTTNGVIWAAFAAEYAWLMRLAPDRSRHLRTHWLDLLIVVLPFLRPLRALRVLRVLRAARLVTVGVYAWRQTAGVMRHRGLGGVLVTVLALILIAGGVAYAIEPQSFGDLPTAMWWVLVTSTTVGYGDFAPVGTGARAVAVVVMIIGVGLVGLITANIVDYLTQSGEDSQTSCTSCEENADRLTRIEAQLEQLLAGAAPGPRRQAGNE
jgi:voltage-gated potassium channel